MSRYLISFPSGAMDFPPEQLHEVARSAHEVVRQAQEAGVWVFGGGIDESIPPVMVRADGTVSKETYPQTRQLEGGYSILDLPSYKEALEWAAKFAAGCHCPQEVRVFQDDPEI